MSNELARYPLASYFFGGLSICKSIWLCKKVRHQLIMRRYLFSINAQVMLTVHETNKVTRDCLAHVQQLEERMLPIGSRLAKVNLTDCIVNFLTIPSNMLAVGLHIKLLNMCGKFQQCFCVWESSPCIVAKEGHIPYTQKSHKNRNIFLKRCINKVLVDGMCSIKKSLEQIISIQKANGYRTCCTAYAIASPDPVPEPEKVVLRVDAKVLNQVGSRYR
mmetsp:Transcript_7173/g.15660  ORF Transcript_7173/g.15660 Transcript_7173/m.15660 type:complete len:218 (-) Transcript_7173:1569-2222(-)